VQAEMVVVEPVVRVAVVMVAQAPVLHKIPRRADWDSVMVAEAPLIQVTEVVVAEVVDILVLVVEAAIQVVWLVAVLLVISAAQVSRVALLLLEVVVHRAIVLMLLEVRVETVELQMRAVTVEDLLSR